MGGGGSEGHSGRPREEEGCRKESHRGCQQGHRWCRAGREEDHNAGHRGCRCGKEEGPSSSQGARSKRCYCETLWWQHDAVIISIIPIGKTDEGVRPTIHKINDKTNDKP